jgi:hypothetical protein
MSDKIDCQGGIQINTQIASGGTGNYSISARLPNGPKPNTIWAIDRCGAIFLDSSQADSFSDNVCGLYIVPISAPLPDAQDNADTIVLAARGVPLFPHSFNAVIGFGYGSGTFQYGEMVAEGSSFIIPAGYTLQAVLTADGIAIVGVVTLNLFAQLRILQQNP